VIVNSDRYPPPPHDYIAQVEVAVGILMELRGWDPEAARARLVLAANHAHTSAEGVARALLSLYP
jgi:hypothetical protein